LQLTNCPASFLNDEHPPLISCPERAAEVFKNVTCSSYRLQSRGVIIGQIHADFIREINTVSNVEEVAGHSLTPVKLAARKLSNRSAAGMFRLCDEPVNSRAAAPCALGICLKAES
jgi:hypothetical protein